MQLLLRIMKEDYDVTNIPTSTIQIVETEHGQMCRMQQGIHMKDLQNARKHGVRTKFFSQNGQPAAK